MAVLLELDGTCDEAVAFNAWLEKEGRVRRKTTQRCMDLNVPRALRTMMLMCNERDTPVRALLYSRTRSTTHQRTWGGKLAQEAYGFAGVCVRVLDQLSASRPSLRSPRDVRSTIGD